MSKPLHFETREAFRDWLSKHSLTSDGVWLVFGKTKELVTLKASEALEEALCFGWIDGLMKSIDDTSYIKYFAARRNNSKWSKKNKDLVIELEKRGLMSDFGRVKVEEAKKNGRWEEAKKPSAISEDEMKELAELLKENEQAYNNFMKMSSSVQKTYTRAYLDAKTEEGRTKRLQWMMDRLEKNLKPM